MNRRLFFGTIFAATTTILLPSIPGFAAPPPADSPRTLVDGFHSKLLAIMKQAKALGMKGRFARLEPEVARRFNIPLMIAIATGKHWRSAQPDERKRLTEAFERFSTATYASRFSGFSGESFETLDVRDGPRKTQLVRTEIRRPEDTPIAITYVTRADKAGWRIVDILVDAGISELAVRRSEYRAILDSGGIADLVSLLEDKTRKLLTQ